MNLGQKSHNSLIQGGDAVQFFFVPRKRGEIDED